MPRRKIAMRLIENPRARATTYAKRTKGLEKKASELSTLCAVSVALVCAPAASAGARLVWESEEGVLDRYRRGAAIPPDTRARHTLRSYLEDELGKERAKLARARPGALADWDAALNDVTLGEAREVLETIEAALRATRDRMAALGLPADTRLEIEQVAASDGAASGVVPRDLGLESNMDMGAGFQMQMMPWKGGGRYDQTQAPGSYEDNNADGDGDASGVVPRDLGLEPNMDMGSGFQMQMMPWQGGGSYDQTQAPDGYGDNNADCGWPDLTMCYAADESWVPAGYYPDFTDGVAAPKHYSAQGVTGGDYAGTLPLGYPMATDENLTYSDMDNSYAGHWQPEEFQRSSTGTGTGQYQYHYHYQCSDPETCSPNQAFNYLYY